MPTEINGLIPAAGQATRIAPLPCSKELFPIGFQRQGQSSRPKVVAQYLLERYGLAGIRKTFLVLRAGKWDIPAYFGDGTQLRMNLAYLLMRLPLGTPYTLDQAYPFIRDNIVALGFPDVIFEPDHAFLPLLERLQATEADVVLGLFPADRPEKVDMVEIDGQGRVRDIVIKPSHTHLQYTWLIAVWRPAFTHFMHQYLADRQADAGQEQETSGQRRELHVGDVIRVALERGMQVEGVLFPEGTYLDIGTPGDLARALKKYTLA